MAKTNKVVITFMSGREDGRSIEFEKLPIIIGRLTDNDLSVPDDTHISGTHAKISYKNDSFWITDLKSRNGVFVGRDKIQMLGAVQLISGALFFLGRTWFKFTVVNIE